MKVAETFMSYQGEGSLIGRRTFFVRLSGCNLKCHWCDTKYAQDETNGKEMTADELYSILLSYKINEIDYFDICITGGEPLLQQTDEELMKFLKQCSLLHSIIVETNGTLVPTHEMCQYANIFMVSPKLSLGTVAYDYFKLEAIESIASFFNDMVYYKFVIDWHDEEVFDSYIEEIKNFVLENDVQYSNIYLMPMGQTKEEIQIGTEKLIKRMTEQNLPYNITSRQHILFSYK